MAVWRASNITKDESNGHYNLQRTASPNQINHRKACRGQKDPISNDVKMRILEICM
jgi:hypothetical protein